MRNARPTALALAIALAAGAAGAGTELATQTLRADGEVQKGLAYLDGKRLRIDARDGRRAVVYRADRGVLWVIDHKKKSYLEVEQPTADALAGEVRSRLEALPPEKRAVADAAAGVDPQLEIRETQLTAKVVGIPCRELWVMRAGERIADVCQASYHDAGVAPESFDAVRELRRLLEESVASLVADEVRGDGLAALGSFGGLDGVPLRVRTWDAGGFDSETVVTSLRERSFAEADFQLPQGYRSRLSINIRGTSPQTP